MIGKKRGIIDLMLSRTTRRHWADEAPYRRAESAEGKIGADEITQAKRYAMALTKDERFHTVKGVRWHVGILSNSYDEARADIEGGPDPARQLIHRQNNITVGIETWGELIEKNRARCQFFQENLQHTADAPRSVIFRSDIANTGGRHRKRR